MISKRHSTWALALLLAAPFAGGGMARAQNQGQEGGSQGQMGPGGRRGPMSPDERLKQMTKNLNLTADQQAKIKPVLEDAQKKMQDLRNGTTGDRQSMRAKMQQIQQDTSTQVRAVLDDKQKEKFDKQEKERERRMQQRRGGMGRSGGPPQPPQQ